MNRALKLPILLTGFFLSILVSFSAFSIRSEASTSLPLQIGLYSYSGGWYANYVYDTNCPGDYYIGLTKGFDLDPNGWSVMIFTQYTGNFSVHYGTDYSFGARDYYNVDCNTSNRRSYTVDGSVYYGWRVNSLPDYYVPSVTLYNSIPEAIRDLTIPPAPEFSDFGFNNITYTTYLQPTASLLFESYNFDALSYYFHWNGSTNSQFPITSFNYELYGFFDTAMDNTDKSNGELVDSGSHSIPNVFDYHVPYGSLTDIFGGMKYDKVILYLTPFSNTTEGNTFYVVLNTVRNIAFNVNLGPLIGFEFGGSVRDVQYSDGVLPVPQTDALLIEDGKYMPVGYIDEVPVIYAVRSVSGSYNRHIDIYNENISYAPVIYGDTEYITNNDNSSVINNNQTYNTIINNINGTVNIDPDNNSSVNSLVDFLKTLITFFATCWNMFSSSLTFIPSWAVNIVTGFYSLTGSILVGLVILKLIRG